MSDFSELTAKSVPNLWTDRKVIFAQDSLDLALTKNIDSAGIAFLVQWTKSLKDKKLKIKNVSEDAMHLIATFKIQSLFEIENK